MLMDELLDWASEEDDAFILDDYYDHPVSLQSLFFLSLQSIKTNTVASLYNDSLFNEFSP